MGRAQADLASRPSQEKLQGPEPDGQAQDFSLRRPVAIRPGHRGQVRHLLLIPLSLSLFSDLVKTSGA